MKTINLPLLVIFTFLVFITSCKDDKYLAPSKGKAAFSLSPTVKGNGRITETTPPAFVLLSIKDSHNNVQENIKLPLFTFGESYLSENLELLTSNYQLTQFVVLDAANKIIYATPLQGSELASYVTDPLPLEFTVTNEGTQVTPQVLAVQSDDDPELFGYASFGFEVVDIVVDLNISLQYPEVESYDSAIIIFKNSTGEIKQKLTLNNSAHIATGRITNILPGEWRVSASYFSTLNTNYESLETMGEVNLRITATTTDIISGESVVYIKDDNDPIYKSFSWTDYYYYHLYSQDKSEGFVRLPKDPTNSFVQISMFNPKWIYTYFDRSFYNSSLDGSSNYYQGGGAMEYYANDINTQDRLDIIDSTSLKPAILQVKDKVWNKADCLVILDDYDGKEIVIYHVWDLREIKGGRINSSSPSQNWSKSEIDERKRIYLR